MSYESRGRGGGGGRGGGRGGYGSRGGGRSYGGRGGGGFRREPREMHDTTCSACGIETKVPFKPSGDRPVYCRECYMRKRDSNLTDEQMMADKKPAAVTEQIVEKKPAATEEIVEKKPAATEKVVKEKIADKKPKATAKKEK